MSDEALARVHEAVDAWLCQVYDCTPRQLAERIAALADEPVDMLDVPDDYHRPGIE